ncbi:hypothetical protein QE369_001863 [Agrobacterium larrymoorei]|uniref:DUF1236 domain-containing protein n=1 Tax=Agrobacterium larrymoorei TaxID=160699 RepID=A0AAJ2B8Y7_9HYPH|nr:DUF1236 domain-containing protein [Agrobacterium larrymoorei]MDR6101685.1 hypothetical protein [Agrobacterium larrymoorei]
MSRTPKMAILAALVASTTLSPFGAVAQDASPDTNSQTNPALLPKKQNPPNVSVETKGGTEVGKGGGKAEATGQSEIKTPAADTNSAVRTETQAKPAMNAGAASQKKDVRGESAGSTDGTQPAGKVKVESNSSGMSKKAGATTSSETSNTTETPKGTDATRPSVTTTETTGNAGSKTGDVSGAASATAQEHKNGSNVSINVTTEQRTEIRNVIVENKVEAVRPTFSVSVGTAVPRTVKLHELPARVIKIVPQYRDYEYIVLSDERIIIIDPVRYEIVYVLTI